MNKKEIEKFYVLFAFFLVNYLIFAMFASKLIALLAIENYWLAIFGLFILTAVLAVMVIRNLKRLKEFVD